MDPDVHGRRFSALPPSSNRSGLGDRFNSCSLSRTRSIRPRSFAPRNPSDALNIVRTRAPVRLAFGKYIDLVLSYVFNHPYFVDCLMLSRMCICVDGRSEMNGPLPFAPPMFPGGAVFVHLCVRCVFVIFRVHVEDGEAQAALRTLSDTLNIVRVRIFDHHAFDLCFMPYWHLLTTRPSDVTVWAEYLVLDVFCVHAGGGGTGRWSRRPTRRFMVHCDLCSSRIRFELYEARVHARPAEGEANAPSSTLSVLARKATKRHHRLATPRRRTFVVSRASNGRQYRTPGGPLAPMVRPTEGVPQLGLPSRSSRWRTQRLGVLTDSFRLIFRHTS
ncbi:hypothetical protein C8Q77DRAFT_1122770, partial [Trametes polyzona]